MISLLHLERLEIMGKSVGAKSEVLANEECRDSPEDIFAILPSATFFCESFNTVSPGIAGRSSL